jgi:hypothetical protein
VLEAEPDQSGDYEDDAPTSATQQRGEPTDPGAGNGTGTRSRMGRALNVQAPGAGREVRESVGKAVAWAAIEDEAARLIAKSAVSISKAKAIVEVMKRRPDLVRAYDQA